MPTFVPSGILIHPTVWPQNTGCKLGAVPLWGGGAGSTSNMWPGPRPTSVPGFTLIHPTVWQQYSNITDRQTHRTDNGPIAKREPFYKQSPKNSAKFCDTVAQFCDNFPTSLCFQICGTNAFLWQYVPVQYTGIFSCCRQIL